MESFYKTAFRGLIRRVVTHSPRIKPQLLILSSYVFNSARTDNSTNAICFDFLNFTLFIGLTRVKNGGSPQMTFTMQLQFSPDNLVTWHNYVVGPFGSLIESAGPDDSIGSGLSYCLDGKCAGGNVRLVCTSVGCDANNTITITPLIGFW